MTHHHPATKIVDEGELARQVGKSKRARRGLGLKHPIVTTINKKDPEIQAIH